MMKTDIDIVVLWVDGNDPSWQKRFNTYAPVNKQIDIDLSEERFRDWDCLKYWFRGVEQFAPWVRTVHLVTDDQVPDWLNKECPKLHLVSHKEYMLAENLPTFNACAIEDNLHRIEGLSEHFIFFNDDMYLIASVESERFFRNGLPTDMAVGNIIQSDGMMGHITLNNLDAVNHHFRKRDVLRRWRQWFNPTYGAYMLRTIALLPWPRFTGFFDHHLPQGYRKQTMVEVWEAEPELLRETSSHRFRHTGDVNQWLLRYWHLCKGEFAPLNVMRDSAVCQMTDDNFEEALQLIQTQGKRIVVLNDGKLSNFSEKKQRMQKAFETILPRKSMFEK